MAHAYDLVIRGGTLADGTGAPLREADVAIRDGLIVEVGTVAGTGAEEIDAKSRLVTPGFVDIHTHYDGQATWDARMQPSSWHGVTTAVMGNCGVGFAPVRPADHNRLIELMEGVEDIPGAALHEGLTWNWQSFPDYLDALAVRSFDMDICAQLPHGALRVFVMGERGANLEAATPDDIASMRALTAEAMRAGAIGFSTSRTLNHRTVKGDPTPSLRATEAELTGIAQGMRDAGSGVFEMISDFDTPDQETEFAMLRRLIDVSGAPMSISLGQAHSSPRGWRKLLDRIGAAARDGQPVRAQVAPRPIGTLYGLQSSLNPFSVHPAFRAIAHLSLAEKVAAFRDPAFVARLKTEAPAEQYAKLVKRLNDFTRIFPLGAEPEYEPPREKSLAHMAETSGRDVIDVAVECLLADEGHAFLFAPFSNYADYNLDACGEMMSDPHTIMGLGDGGAHVGLISDGSFPTYLLSHWGRDRAHGRFPVEQLVKKQTSDTARAVGLYDRGVVAAGYKADLNIIDFDRLALEVPVMAFDLPAGGKRLLQRARGYEATIVSGAVTYRNGEATDALPGRLVRGPQPVPQQ
ncbi:MAG: amidohydrolase family protein [Parvibaculum sp.]|nr:amidohydrolase family protein [Parvibaculum sp.]